MKIWCLTGIALLLCSSGEAATLTGAIVFGLNASGNYEPVFVWGDRTYNNAWNTVGGDLPYNLYLTIDGIPVNSGSGSETSIHLPLDLGRTYVFGLAVDGGFSSNFGLNLFFDGEGLRPGISAVSTFFSPSGPPLPPDHFRVNSSQLTADLFGGIVPGAGSTTYRSGGEKVELVGLEFYATLGQYAAPYSEIPELQASYPDMTGAFALSVTSDVPEPNNFAVVATAALLAAVYCHWRAHTVHRHW